MNQKGPGQFENHLCGTRGARGEVPDEGAPELQPGPVPGPHALVERGIDLGLPVPGQLVRVCVDAGGGTGAEGARANRPQAGCGALRGQVTR